MKLTNHGGSRPKPGRPKKETKQFSIRCYPDDLKEIREFCKMLIKKRES